MDRDPYGRPAKPSEMTRNLECFFDNVWRKRLGVEPGQHPSMVSWYKQLWALPCFTATLSPSVTPKAAASHLVNRVKRAGLIVPPAGCERCGGGPTQYQSLHGHHADYSKPLEVEWLCARCHVLQHLPQRVATLAARKVARMQPASVLPTPAHSDSAS